MPISNKDEEATPVLIELLPESGSVTASFTAKSARPDAYAAIQSVEDMSTAMSLVRSMAQCLVAAVDDGDLSPSGAEVDFGIKFDSNGGAFLARSGPDATIGVKLIWIR
jgi:hypothetical protein